METVPGSDNYKLMIGIGVNLNTSEFHYSDLKIATSILIETGMRTSVSEFSIILAQNIAKLFNTL
jgi:biotin-(acetyl-CoA carboxylase) ligase